MDEIEWEAPPSYARVIGSGEKVGRYAKFAAELRDHLEEWAVLPDMGATPRTEGSASGLASNIRRNRMKGFETGTYETAISESKIWVRCIDRGEDQAPQQPAPRPASSGPDPVKVRTWARDQGVSVSDHGRLPKQLIESYLEEHPEEQATVRVVR